MKINISKKEYLKLIDLLYLADWIVTAHEEGGRDEDNSYHPLIQKLYACAKEFGCENLIEHSKQLDGYFPTRMYEGLGVRDFIDNYDNETFWAELIARLTDRDFERIHGGKEMEMKERFGHLSEIEEKYADEFSTNGLNSLETKK